MLAMIRSGYARGLQDAYDKAIRLSPAVAAKQAEKAADEQAKKDAEKAAKFAPSVERNYVEMDTIVGDANPYHQTQFSNDFTYGRWTLSTLLDWRNGGLVSNMTNNLWDEGGNSRDFDEPFGATTKGLYRYYDTFSAGDSRVYIQPGTFLKLREVTVSYQAPNAFVNRWLKGAKDLRVSFSGRNLWVKTDYWSYDPEFNNFGNTNFNRFIDLAPFPTSRQFFFSVDLGY